MELKEVISFSDLAVRFAKAKRLQDKGYQWMRGVPGRGKKKKGEKIGNSLAIKRAIKSFNAANSNPIQVYKVKGYDGTSRAAMVISKAEIIRLKGYIQRGGGSGKPGRKKQIVEFKVVEKVKL